MFQYASCSLDVHIFCLHHKPKLPSPQTNVETSSEATKQPQPATTQPLEPAFITIDLVTPGTTQQTETTEQTHSATTQQLKPTTKDAARYTTELDSYCEVSAAYLYWKENDGIVFQIGTNHYS